MSLWDIIVSVMTFVLALCVGVAVGWWARFIYVEIRDAFEDHTGDLL
jgi:hypothetical protein